MALRKTVEFKGMTVTGAYIRVSRLTILPGNTSMEFGVQFASNAAEASFDTSIEYADYKLEGGNPINQAYLYLKTLEKFQGAEDC